MNTHNERGRARASAIRWRLTSLLVPAGVAAAALMTVATGSALAEPTGGELLASGLEGSIGGAIGPDGALYVPEGVAGENHSDRPGDRRDLDVRERPPARSVRWRNRRGVHRLDGLRAGHVGRSDDREAVSVVHERTEVGRPTPSTYRPASSTRSSQRATDSSSATGTTTASSASPSTALSRNWSRWRT